MKDPGDIYYKEGDIILITRRNWFWKHWDRLSPLKHLYYYGGSGRLIDVDGNMHEKFDLSFYGCTIDIYRQFVNNIRRISPIETIVLFHYAEGYKKHPFITYFTKHGT